MAQLTQSGCESRRRRLVDRLASLPADAALITDVRDIYYFTGCLTPGDLPALLVVTKDGRTHCFAPEGTEWPNSSDLEVFSWNVAGTRHRDIGQSLLDAVAQSSWLKPFQRFAIQDQSIPARLRTMLVGDDPAASQPIDQMLAEMQACKDPDEIEVLRRSVSANLGAYDAIREAIQPGVLEIDVLAAGYGGAMRAAGEKVLHDGDYRSGQFNGPARCRPIQAGELYIVDAWTCYRGYWSDMSRTFVVGRHATDVQLALFEHIKWVLAEVGKLLRPGLDGKEVFRALDEMLRLHRPLADVGLTHHGGHAIGLRAHEMPDVNAARGGIIQPGNVLCIEPGGYFQEARAGVRLENMYLITEHGCENLCGDELNLPICG